MEKRNFVTSKRTSDQYQFLDGIIDKAAAAFGEKRASAAAKNQEFVKRASLEDEKADSED